MSEGNGLSPGWARAHLSRVLKRITSGSRNWKQYYDDNGSACFIRTQDVAKDQWDLASIAKINPPENQERERTRAYPNDLVMTITGWIGITKVVPEKMDDAYVNQSVALISLFEHIDSRFVSYQLNSSALRALTNELSIGVGRSSLSLESLHSIPLKFAPLAEQRRIVAAIEEQFAHLDAGVAALERARKGLKRYRASMLKAAVEGRLTKEWREENPDAESGSALLERILEERRAKWEEAQLAKYAAKEQNPPKNWRLKYKEPAAPDTADLPELPEGWAYVPTQALLPLS